MVLPQKGDIIRFPRKTGYSHYGIYIGDGKVIHMTNVQGEGPSGIKGTKCRIRTDDLKDIVGQSGQAEIANYLDGQSKPFSPDEIVKRAESKLGEGDYSVVTNNCEHFVTWCRYGEATSKQVDAFMEFAATIPKRVIFLVKQLLETLPNPSAALFQ